MGIVKTTAYPSRYMDEEDDMPVIPEPSVGKFHIQFDIIKPKGKTQRDLAQVVALAKGIRSVYQRSERYYRKPAQRTAQSRRSPNRACESMCVLSVAALSGLQKK